MQRSLVNGLAAVLVIGLAGRLKADLDLASDGKTDYVVVPPSNASPVDDYAVATLTNYLHRITGAEFPVVAGPDWAGRRGASVPLATPMGESLPGDASGTLAPRGDLASTNAAAIFVGLSDPARAALGADPLAGLAEEDHVARSIDANIFLYGKGVHGNLWAVMDFLETSLGRRWYSVHEAPVVPAAPSLTLAPFDRKRGFSFGYRQVQLNHGTDFYYQHGINMGYALKGWSPPFISRLPSTVFVHSSFAYIPPTPDNKYGGRFPWQDKRNYFETDPDFFTMDERGQRVADKQLCFSNPRLREALTANVIQDIEHSRTRSDEGLIITIDAADTPGTFCYCPGCVKLEEKYRNTGGPLYDYIIELCGRLAKDYPGVMVRTLAYRRSQTQHPPVLPNGGMFPENFIVAFAPIEDNYFADWWNSRDAMIQETYRDLRGWGRITHHLWAWIYPNPWGTGARMPVGNIERLIDNVRLMKYAGVEGLFADHHGINERAGFHELQAYLLLHLMQDVNCDTDALIRDFTDHHYGAAGARMRNYIHELEQCRKDMALPPGVTFKSANYDDRTFPYVTADNIHRWQVAFDEMERLTAGEPAALLHVQTVRRELDFATLWKWFAVTAKYPDYFRDYTVVAARIEATNDALSRGTHVRPLGGMQDFINVILAGGKERPLPKQFDGIDRARIRTLLPTRYRGGARTVLDPDAAMGYAVPVDAPGGLPFPFGFHQMAAKKRIVSGKLEAADIVPGEYRLYEIGEVPMEPDSVVYFGRSWQTHLKIGERLYEPGSGNRWDIYVSLKFDGPSYGGAAKEDLVLVDRVIAVSKSEDQFAAP